MEHAIVEIGGRYLHVISEAEPPLKLPTCKPAVQVALILLLFLLGFARDPEYVLLDGDVEIVRREPSHRHRQAIGVVAGLLDIVRGVAEGRAVDASGRIKHAGQSVKADRRTE